VCVRAHSSQRWRSSLTYSGLIAQFTQSRSERIEWRFDRVSRTRLFVSSLIVVKDLFETRSLERATCCRVSLNSQSREREREREGGREGGRGERGYGYHVQIEMRRFKPVTRAVPVAGYHFYTRISYFITARGRDLSRIVLSVSPPPGCRRARARARDKALSFLPRGKGEGRNAGVTRDVATRVLFLCAANTGPPPPPPPPRPRREDVFKQGRPRLSRHRRSFRRFRVIAVNGSFASLLRE